MRVYSILTLLTLLSTTLSLPQDDIPNISVPDLPPLPPPSIFSSTKSAPAVVSKTRPIGSSFTTDSSVRRSTSVATPTKTSQEYTTPNNTSTFTTSMRPWPAWSDYPITSESTPESNPIYTPDHLMEEEEVIVGDNTTLPSIDATEPIDDSMYTDLNVTDSADEMNTTDNFWPNTTDYFWPNSTDTEDTESALTDKSTLPMHYFKPTSPPRLNRKPSDVFPTEYSDDEDLMMLMVPVMLNCETIANMHDKCQNPSSWRQR